VGIQNVPYSACSNEQFSLKKWPSTGCLDKHLAKSLNIIHHIELARLMFSVLALFQIKLKDWTCWTCAERLHRYRQCTCLQNNLLTESFFCIWLLADYYSISWAPQKSCAPMSIQAKSKTGIMTWVFANTHTCMCFCFGCWLAHSEQV